MAQQKILTNLTGATILILNREVAHTESNDIQHNFWLELAKDTSLHSLISAGTVIVNDGTVDLAPQVALAHVQSIDGVNRNHSDITLLPAVTIDAPELVKLSSASIGFNMEIGNEIFGQSRINNYVADPVEIQLHMAINNSIADRWVQFEIYYITTNGRDDKNMDSIVGTLVMGPIEIPTTPYRIFESVVSIPESDLNSGENYIFIGIKRVTATGKTAPTNDPVVLRYCKRFWEKAES